MSEALFGLSGLRFWHEDELLLREAFRDRIAYLVQRTLLDLNPAWRFARCEGPILHPRSKISAAYDETDIFVTNDERGGEALCLRPETTPSSYAYAKWMGGKLPLCVWQAGISSRREKNDGASGGKLRFNSFWQLEFQCIYGADTKADYRAALVPVIEAEIARFTCSETRVVDSDRLPAYSQSTIDIEALRRDKWIEMASCSIRTDYSEETRVCEIAIGLDRVATLAAEVTQ
tara:strand:+ start:217 stop:912 length:696 start_codon:yes stop_codon:yes gene_type:complete